MSELVGQEHITTALSRALEQGTFAHAYLFTGPRGTGKTSIARILAHEINGLPYEDDASHLDIIEIDAASNRRIDEIRELRDKVHIAPAAARYKVYIIDEVHMLTKEAFNALLKTLEEPPAHVIFILATTEVHKLPETIISRTQRFTFKPVELPKVIGHLKKIAEQEKITIDDQALELIAAHGEGSFRDSISLLDQTRNSGEEVTLADVQALLGIAPAEQITTILQAVYTHDPAAIAASLRTIHEQGYEPAQTARQLASRIREDIIAGTPAVQSFDALGLLSALIQVPASRDPRASLEIALFDAALQPLNTIKPPAAQKPTTAVAAVQAKPPVQIEPHPSTLRKPPAPAPVADTKTEPKPELKKTKQEANPITGAKSSGTLDPQSWSAVLDTVRKQYNTLYSMLKAAQPVFNPGEVILECGFAFHKKQLTNSRNKGKLAAIISEVTGQNINIRCELVETMPTPPPVSLPPADEQIHTITPKKGKDNEDLKAVSDIFGGAELLES